MHKPIIIDYINIQRKMGFSPLILIVGRQRVGKTAIALRLAYEIMGDKFDIKKHMTYKIEDFAEAYDKYSNVVLILDEAGIPLDPYEHMTITQRVYTHIVQTQAYKQNIVFLVLPFASEIGKNHAKHISCIVEVVWRGCYKLYATKSWHSDLSKRPPRLEKIEVVSGVPLPPPELWSWYKSQGQDEYKKSIMEMQMGILKARQSRRTGQPQHNFVDPQQFMKVAQQYGYGN